MHLVSFDTAVAHTKRHGRAGAESETHWAMLAGYDAETDSAIIADADYDTYGRLWYKPKPPQGSQ